MAQTEVLMPKMGESVIEATIIKWTKNEGDAVKADETLLEIATDKVDSEIPAPSDGILLKKLCKEGDVIPVGKGDCHYFDRWRSRYTCFCTRCRSEESGFCCCFRSSCFNCYCY